MKKYTRDELREKTIRLIHNFVPELQDAELTEDSVINTDAGYEELTDDDTPLYGEGDVDDEPLYNPYGVPGTGDESNIPVWAGLCALALAGIIVMMIGRRKKEEE